MKLQQLIHTFFRSARANPPSDATPYAFEQRVMARIRALPQPDAWAVWSAALWRAAVACLALTLLSGAWSVWSARSSESNLEFSQEFERAMVMADSDLDDAW